MGESCPCFWIFAIMIKINSVYKHFLLVRGCKMLKSWWVSKGKFLTISNCNLSVSCALLSNTVQMLRIPLSFTDLSYHHQLRHCNLLLDQNLMCWESVCSVKHFSQYICLNSCTIFICIYKTTIFSGRSWRLNTYLLKGR